jgi:hypothetical protein
LYFVGYVAACIYIRLCAPFVVDVSVARTGFVLMCFVGYVATCFMIRLCAPLVVGVSVAGTGFVFM